MNQRGRKSNAALAVVSDVPGLARLAPVSGLTDGERRVWLATVNARPADWFGSEHVPLLVNYCRHACRADVLAAQLAVFEPDWLKTEEGLRRFQTISKMARDESHSMNTLARAMRLTHQSLYRADKAASTVDGVARGLKPWEQTDEED